MSDSCGAISPSPLLILSMLSGQLHMLLSVIIRVISIPVLSPLSIIFRSFHWFIALRVNYVSSLVCPLRLCARPFGPNRPITDDIVSDWMFAWAGICWKKSYCNICHWKYSNIRIPVSMHCTPCFGLWVRSVSSGGNFPEIYCSDYGNF